MENQSFNLNADFLGGYSALFLKMLIAVILVYVFILILNFFRDQFIHKGSSDKNPDILDLLSILNKVCFVSGFGFVLGNIVQGILNETNNSSQPLQFRGEWDYIAFGIILIFIGIGFKHAKKSILADRQKKVD